MKWPWVRRSAVADALNELAAARGSIEQQSEVIAVYRDCIRIQADTIDGLAGQFEMVLGAVSVLLPSGQFASAKQTLGEVRSGAKQIVAMHSGALH